jgi:crotonobetainyl-CoA:carnitine CoA-transferase CaiB-like acyl-CoA transferase
VSGRAVDEQAEAVGCMNGPAAADAVLGGLRVVELVSGIAGWSAGLHLSEAGAEVFKVEAPEGDPARDTAPFTVLNRGKKSVVLDVSGAAGRAQLQQILAAADVLIHDLPPAAAAAAGLADAALTAAFPSLIVSAIGAWPQDHAWAESPVREPLVLARLGVLDEQPGHRDGPIYIRMPYANWIAGWLAAIGVMARLLARERDGRGGIAHTSLAQAALVPMGMHWSRAEKPTPAFSKGLGKNIPIPLHPCSDGRWIHVHYSPDKAPWMAQAFAEMGEAAVAAANAKFPPSHVAPNFGANRQVIATRPAEDWVQHFWEHDVAAQIAAPFGEIYFDEQARLNDYVVEVDDPLLGQTLQPGPSYRVEPPARVRGPLRDLGIDTDDAFAARPPKATDVPASHAGSTPLSPLHGLKVLDLGAYLAGPFACMVLADLGADVIKVEPPAGDAMRRLERIFVGTQRGKQGLALKLGEPASQPVLDTMVRWADVVHHNIRMPAARKLGVDPQRLLGVNPALVFGHISSYGPTGPRADWPGFDQLMQAACGWEIESGGAGRPPLWLRLGVGDYLAALSCVYAVLLGLVRRGRTGEGQAVASSLLGAMLLTASEVIARPDGSVTPMAHLDAAQTGLSRGDRLYHCTDGWLMVAAWTPSEIAAFDALVGAEPDHFFAGLTVDQAATQLDAAQVPNAPALEDQREAFLDDPRHAKLRSRSEHAVYGELEQIGALWDFGDLPLSLDRPPPALGQHSHTLLREHGFSDVDITRLVAQGITSP